MKVMEKNMVKKQKLSLDRTKYEREFKEGIPNGQGKMTYSDGCKHEVEFKNGRP